MYVKIFFNDKPLFLCDAISPEIEPFLHHDDAVFVDEFSTPAVNSMLHEMVQPKIHAGIFLHSDFKELKKAFWKKFMLVEAAGGAVLNPDNELMLIYRRGKWDLPKGKLEEKEAQEAGAIREVMEETGLTDVNAIKPLLTTYHTYNESGHHILKPSYWYLMRTKQSDGLVPQTEEDIHEVKWVPFDQLGPYMENSFPSIRDVVEKLQEEMRGFY